MEGASRTRFSVYVSLVITCIGISLATNAVWVQMPVLEKTLAEVRGKELPMYLLVLTEAGNVSVLLFIFFRKCCSNRLNEVPCLYICIALKITCCTMLALYWKQTTHIFDDAHSLAFIACVFVLCQMAALGPVLYIPFGGRFKSQYMTAVFIGEALAALIPHILGIAEGVLLPSDCSQLDGTAGLNSTQRKKLVILSQYRPGMHRPSTTPVPLVPPDLRFEEFIYFYAIAGVLGLGGVAFLVLRHVPSIRFEYEETRIDTAAEDAQDRLIQRFISTRLQIARRASWQMLDDEDTWQAGGAAANSGNVRILDDGSVRGSVHRDGYATASAAAVARHNQVFNKNTGSPNKRLLQHADASPQKVKHNNSDSPVKLGAGQVYLQDHSGKSQDRLLDSPRAMDHAPPYPESPVNRFSNSPLVVNKRQSDPDRVHFSNTTTVNTHTSSRTATPTVSRPRLSSRSSSQRSRFTSTGSDFREAVSRQPSFSFTLLMTIVVWCSAVIHGPLSSVKSHSCLPVNNMFFLTGTLVSNVAGVIACIVTHRFMGKLSITIIVALTSLGTILLTYFVALLAFSHASESSEQSLIFSKAGELLGTIAWVAIVGLFSFARVGIAVICREVHEDWLFYFALAAQVGCAVGSVCIADFISICMVYRNFQKTTCPVP